MHHTRQKGSIRISFQTRHRLYWYGLTCTISLLPQALSSFSIFHLLHFVPFFFLVWCLAKFGKNFIRVEKWWYLSDIICFFVSSRLIDKQIDQVLEIYFKEAHTIVGFIFRISLAVFSVAIILFLRKQRKNRIRLAKSKKHL